MPSGADPEKRNSRANRGEVSPRRPRGFRPVADIVATASATPPITPPHAPRRNVRLRAGSGSGESSRRPPPYVLDLKGPFGALEQRELRSLSAAGAMPAFVCFLLTLRVRLDGKSGVVLDTLENLAMLACMSLATARRSMVWLKQRGVVVEERHHMHGGVAGTAWSFRRRPLRFDHWPEELRRLSGTPSEEPLAEKASSVKSRSDQRQEPPKAMARAAQSTRHNPEAYPKPLQRGNFHSENPTAEANASGETPQSKYALKVVEAADGPWRDALKILHQRATGNHGLFLSTYVSTRLEKRQNGYAVIAPNEFARGWLASKAVGVPEALREALKLEHVPTVIYESAK